MNASNKDGLHLVEKQYDSKIYLKDIHIRFSIHSVLRSLDYWKQLPFHINTFCMIAQAHEGHLISPSEWNQQSQLQARLQSCWSIKSLDKREYRACSSPWSFRPATCCHFLLHVLLSARTMLVSLYTYIYICIFAYGIPEWTVQLSKSLSKSFEEKETMWEDVMEKTRAQSRKANSRILDAEGQAWEA